MIEGLMITHQLYCIDVSTHFPCPQAKRARRAAFVSDTDEEGVAPSGVHSLAPLDGRGRDAVMDLVGSDEEDEEEEHIPR
jgi:hypothetical protein